MLATSQMTFSTFSVKLFSIKSLIQCKKPHVNRSFSFHATRKLGILGKKVRNYSNQNQRLVTSHYGLVSLHIENLIENSEFGRPQRVT